MAWPRRLLYVTVVVQCVQIISCEAQPEYTCTEEEDYTAENIIHCNSNHELTDGLPGTIETAQCTPSSTLIRATLDEKLVDVEPLIFVICDDHPASSGLNESKLYSCSSGNRDYDWLEMFSLNITATRGVELGSSCYVRLCVKKQGTIYRVESVPFNACSIALTESTTTLLVTAMTTSTMGHETTTHADLGTTPVTVTVSGTDEDTIGKYIEQILAPVVAVLVSMILLVLVVVITLYLILQLRMRKYTRSWQVYGSPELPFDPHYTPVDIDKPSYKQSHRMSLLSVEGIFQSLYVDQAKGRNLYSDKVLRPPVLSDIYGTQHSHSNLGKKLDDNADPAYVKITINKKNTSSMDSQSTNSMQGTDTTSKNSLDSEVSESRPSSTTTYVRNSFVETEHNLLQKQENCEYEFHASLEDDYSLRSDFDNQDALPPLRTIGDVPYPFPCEGASPLLHPPAVTMHSVNSSSENKLNLSLRTADGNYDRLLKSNDESEFLSCEDHSDSLYTTTFQPSGCIEPHLRMPNPISTVPILPNPFASLSSEHRNKNVETENQESIQLDSQYVSSESGYIQSRSTCTEVPAVDLGCFLTDVEDMLDGDVLVEGEDKLQSSSMRQSLESPALLSNIRDSSTNISVSDSSGLDKAASVSDEEVDMLTLDEPLASSCCNEHCGYIADDYTATGKSLLPVDPLRDLLGDRENLDISDYDCLTDLNCPFKSTDTSDYQQHRTGLDSGLVSYSDYVTTSCLSHMHEYPVDMHVGAVEQQS